MPLWVSTSSAGRPKSGTFCESDVVLTDNNAVWE